MVRLNFRDRLQIMAAGVDFLLNHPGLKRSDVLAGIMILRQTILFGKVSDTMTLRQLAKGVRNLNRGTGVTARRLSHSVACLVLVGFIRISKPKICWHGTTVEVRVENILEYVKALRKTVPTDSAEGERSSLVNDSPQDLPPVIPHGRRRGSSGNSPHTNKLISSAPNAQDVEELETELGELVRQLGVPLPPVDHRTCINLLDAARGAQPAATPKEIVWFIRNRLVEHKTRFRSWGGIVVAVRGDFGEPPHRS